MNWEDQINMNEQKLLDSYQKRFDKAVRSDNTTMVHYWHNQIVELTNEIKRRSQG